MSAPNYFLRSHDDSLVSNSSLKYLQLNVYDLPQSSSV